MPGYNYMNHKPPEDNRGKLNLNPLAILILCVFLTVMNIGSFILIGADTLSIISLAACIVGVIVSAWNLYKERQKNRK